MKKTFLALSCIVFLAAGVSVNAAEPIVFDGREFATKAEFEAYQEEQAKKEKDELRAGITSSDGTKTQLIDEKWTVIIKPSALGDRDFVTVSLEPDFGEKGYMAVRCKDNSTDVIISVREYMGTESIPLEYKIGDAPIVKERTSPAADGSAFFVRNPIQFLKKLSGEKKLALRVSPYNSSSTERVFNIEGIEKIIEPIERACNWKLKK